MKYITGLLFLLLIANVYAVCEDGQVDVNSASLEKLDELDGIGPVKAQAIIDYRNSKWFGSVDDLIDVYGIGEVTLQKIKTQGLACVGEEEQDEEDEDIDTEQSSVTPTLDTTIQKEPISSKERDIELEIITLNSPTKDIKSEDESKNLSKNGYAKYGFVGFCVLLAVLFVLKKPKQEID